MTVTVLCLKTGAFGESFAYEIAAAPGVQVVDMRPLELGVAEWDPFCNGAAQCGGAGESHRVQSTRSEIEEHSVRLATRIVEAAKGDVLVVGWSAAVVLALAPSDPRMYSRAAAARCEECHAAFRE